MLQFRLRWYEKWLVRSRFARLQSLGLKLALDRVWSGGRATLPSR